MKLLVFSDSHGNSKNMEAVLEKLEGEISHVFFLGDCYEDINMFAGMYDNIEFYAVVGNCDPVIGRPEEGLVTVGGKKVFFCHGHKYGVKVNNCRIAEKAAQKGADICLFGHTHHPEVTKVNGVLLLNPGSISLPKHTQYPTYGIVDIGDVTVSGSVVECLGGGLYRPCGMCQ